MSFKEVTTEQLVSSIKKGAGRPSKETADRIAMDEILLSQQKREALVSEVKRISLDKRGLKLRADSLREDTKAIAEGFNLSVAKFNQLIADFDTGDLKEVISVKTSYVDVLTIIDEQVNKDNAEGDDE